MPARRKAAKKKPKGKKKVVKKKAIKKTVKKKVARKKIARPAPMPPAGPKYSCVLCGVEVAVSKEGLGISRLMCCGQPMEQR